MGICTKASPAKTTSPILSDWFFSNIFATICFALCNLFGLISSANILFETSKAIIISRLRVSTLILLPVCGRAIAIISKAKTANKTMYLNKTLYFEKSGFNFSIKSISPNFSSLFFLKYWEIKNKPNKTGIINNSQKYSGFLN